MQEPVSHLETPGVNELNYKTLVDLKSKIKNACHVRIVIWEHFERCHRAEAHAKIKSFFSLEKEGQNFQHIFFCTHNILFPYSEHHIYLGNGSQEGGSRPVSLPTA